tara:strand:- start:814 stop:1065 length:252 start_codon:yes stop_codon:yes gene_type:complete
MAISNAFNRSGGTGSSGGGSSSSVEYSFTNQSSVTITHTFETKPSVWILDTSGNIIHADIQYTSSSQILINFAISLSGVVVLR